MKTVLVTRKPVDSHPRVDQGAWLAAEALFLGS